MEVNSDDGLQRQFLRTNTFKHISTSTRAVSLTAVSDGDIVTGFPPGVIASFVILTGNLTRRLLSGIMEHYELRVAVDEQIFEDEG